MPPSRQTPNRQPAAAAPAASAYALPRWCDDMAVVAGGWEPLMYCRRDTPGEDLEASFVRQHRDASLRRFAQEGIDLFITHYHKGFGWEVIQDEIRDVKRQIATMHRAGMRAGVYFRVDNIIGETFFLERPEAREWLVKPQDGGCPTILNRPFRFRVCRNVPAYREYARNVLLYAIREMGVDAFSLDGFHGSAEREECRCEHCQQRFQNFLKARWDGRPEDAERLFGFSRVDGIRIPSVAGGNRSEASAALITDPVYQEYIRFRCEDWADWQRFLLETIRGANPEVIAALNCGVFSWQNTAAQSGMHLPLLDKRNTMIFVEDGHFAWVREGGVLCHRIRDYKVASAVGMKCIAYSHEYNVPYMKRVMSESMAFNGGMIGCVNTEGDPNASLRLGEEAKAARRRVIDWRKRNPELWRNTRPASEVGVLRGYESMAYDCYGAWRHTMLIEETLIRNQIPFDPVFDEHLPELGRRGIKVLVLGGQSCLSDGAAKTIARFVREGGHLLVTGATGDRTEHAVLRPQNAILKSLGLLGGGAASLRGAPRRPTADTQPRFESVLAARCASWPNEAVTLTRVCGGGTVAYVPDVVPAVDENWYPAWEKDEEIGYYRIRSSVPAGVRTLKEYAFVNWRLPVNAGQIVDAIRCLYEAPFIIDAPDTVAVNWLRREAGDLLHFVNYANDAVVSGASIFFLDDRVKAAEFRRLDPEPAKIALKARRNERRLRLPPFLTYGVLLMER